MNRGRWFVGVFALLAFAQTLAYFVYLRDDPGNYNGAGAQGDQVAYIGLGQQLLQGGWSGAMHYMPGLPAVVAASQLAFGDPHLGIALVQGILYALMVVYAARLATRAFGERAGTWSAALVGLNPAIGYYAAQVLTEFLTGMVLLLLVGTIHAWARSPSLLRALLAGALVAAAAYLRAEYLALAILLAAVLLWLRPRRALASAAGLVAATALLIAPWIGYYAVTTGHPALYNESPFSNLFLMGTWFRVFDEQTFAQLQQIETAPGSRDEAISRAATVGPRPELSQRYMEQARGPYERPLGETLSLAYGNVQLNLRQYLVNHLVEAPILIWAGRTPVRQADAPHLPASGRYAIWASELALLGLALWQAIRAMRDPHPSPLPEGEGEGGPLRLGQRRGEALPLPLGQRRGEALPLPLGQRRGEALPLPLGEGWGEGARALAASFLVIVVFLTAVHVVLAVDERFTTPALLLLGLFAGSRLSELLRARRAAAVEFAA